MRQSQEGAPAGHLFDPRAVAAGAATSLAASAAVALAAGLAVYFTALTETYLALALYYAGFLVVLVGGMVAARAARRLGWLHGGMAGAVTACLALVAVAVLFPGSLLPAEVARQAGLAFLTGAVGGVIGVNL